MDLIFHTSSECIVKLSNFRVTNPRTLRLAYISIDVRENDRSAREAAIIG